MKVWQKLKRLPLLTFSQQMASTFRPIGFLKNRPALVRPLIANGEVGVVEGFRIVVSENLR